MTLRSSLAALVAAVFVASAGLPAFAYSVTVGPLTITDLWTRATPPGAPAAGGYLTIANTGAEADLLIAASSPIAAVGELHQMAVTDGVMTMRPVEGGIEIPPGETVALAPGGMHLMFISLSQPLAEGDSLPVTLTFEKAGSVDTMLHVLAIGSPGPASEDAEHGAMEMEMPMPGGGQ